MPAKQRPAAPDAMRRCGASLTRAVAAIAFSVVTGCGGGGGGGSQGPTLGATPTPGGSAAPSPAPHGSPGPSGSPTPINHQSPNSSPTPVATPTSGVSPTPVPTPVPTPTPMLTPTPIATPAVRVASNAIYMGVFDNVSNIQPNAAPHPDIITLETAIGRREAINMHYMSWTNLQSMNPLTPGIVASCTIGSCTDLDADKVYGRIPLIAWNCGDTDARVASGADDALITASAAAVKAYANPVMIRWFWEMTLINTDQHRSASCYDPAYDGVNGNTGRANYFDGVMYVRAWQHIWTIFHNLQVTNVIWVWNPGDTSIQDAPLYWPGSAYVDWIAGDIYDRQDLGLAAELDSPPVAIPPPPAPLPSAVPYSLYGILSSLDPAKPLFIAENGAHTDWAVIGPGSNNQELYFGASTYGADYVLKQHPRIHAYNYFDADESFNNLGVPIQPPPEVANDWDLVGGGLAAYAAFANGAYESLTAVPPSGPAFAPRGLLRKPAAPFRRP